MVNDIYKEGIRGEIGQALKTYPVPPLLTVFNHIQPTHVLGPQWLQVLLQYGGQEAAEAFEEVGHSDFARPLAQKVGLSAGYYEVTLGYMDQPGFLPSS